MDSIENLNDTTRLISTSFHTSILEYSHKSRKINCATFDSILLLIYSMDSIENLNDTTYDSTYFYFLLYFDISEYSQKSRKINCASTLIGFWIFAKNQPFRSNWKFKRYHVFPLFLIPFISRYDLNIYSQKSLKINVQLSIV